jgi:hypothetical protein
VVCQENLNNVSLLALQAWEVGSCINWWLQI